MGCPSIIPGGLRRSAFVTAQRARGSFGLGIGVSRPGEGVRSRFRGLGGAVDSSWGNGRWWASKSVPVWLICTARSLNCPQLASSTTGDGGGFGHKGCGFSQKGQFTSLIFS